MASVLVVDDNPDSCRVLMRFISRFNGPADCVESGAEALKYIETHTTKLIFLDWMMPEMTGLDVLRALRANSRFKDLPVVMFSALSDPSVQQEALRAGAQAFIVKGQFDEALATIKKYIGGSH